MGLSKKQAVAYMSGAVLLLVALIFIARLLPYAYHYATQSPDSINTSLGDVPGGALFTGFIFFLLALVLGISLVVKAFDLF